MNEIKWGIIGCGDVTEVKSGPAFSKIPGSKLVAVMRRDAQKAADYAARHQVGRWYSDAEVMMNDADINAVYIATPPSSHLYYVQQALQKGLNVYVEKPVTVNAAESKQMLDAVKTSNGKLVVAHYRRAVPLFLKIKDLIDLKVIGEIRTIQIRMWQSQKPQLIAQTTTNWRIDPAVSGGGYFHDLAPHQLDILYFYFGKPVKYHGYSLNQSGESSADDHVCGQILFKNNVMVNGSWCFNVAKEQETDTCEIIGSEGKITFAFFGNYVTWEILGKTETEVFIHPPHIEQPMIEQVVSYFNGQRDNPCSIEEAITTMEVIDAFTR
jgi:predicted dehydrogenase